MTFQEENDKLMWDYINRLWFKAWRLTPEEKAKQEWSVNYQSLELDINYRCNLKCKYCYVARYGDELYPPEISDDATVLKNLGVILDFLVDNKMTPNLEIFTGEAFIQPVVFKAIDMMLEKLEGHISTPIVVPTNYSFLLSENLAEKVEDAIKRSEDAGLPIVLSSSIDGKYCEANRPFALNMKSGKKNNHGGYDWEMKTPIFEPRGDAFYDKVFTFNKKYNYGFHPMIYSDHIENWKDNFLWYQSMFKKFDIPWQNLYLLEIRNAEWSLEQCKEFANFTEFLVKWSFNMCRNSLANYKNFLFKAKGFNILNAPLSTIGRGLGCSYQSTMQLRLGDLNISPCHRTSYSHLMIGKFKVENSKIVGIHAQNPELYIGSTTFEANTLPYCEQCMIKNLCSHGCLGAQLETTGDMFTPFPSMCRMEHWKLIGMIRAYKSLGILGDIINFTPNDKKESLKYLGGLL